MSKLPVQHGKDLLVFAVRPESLAKEADQRHDIIYSRELRERFLSTILSKANKFILTHNWQTKQATVMETNKRVGHNGVQHQYKKTGLRRRFRS